MQNYEVGQIVYLLVKGEMKVIPTRVVEAITRRRLNGSETTYMVQLPDKDRTVIDLTELDAERSQSCPRSHVGAGYCFNRRDDQAHRSPCPIARDASRR